MSDKPARARKTPKMITIELDMSFSDPGLESLQPAPHLEDEAKSVARRWKWAALAGAIFAIFLGILIGRFLLP